MLVAQSSMFILLHGTCAVVGCNTCATHVQHMYASKLLSQKPVHCVSTWPLGYHPVCGMQASCPYPANGCKHTCVVSQH